MDKDHIIKVLTTSLENNRKAKPEIDRLQKAYKEVSEEKDKALARVAADFDKDLSEIKTAVEAIAEQMGIPLGIGYFSDRERFLPFVLHSELSQFDYKLASLRKKIPNLTISDEAIIELFATEFGDIIQYWSPSYCY